LFEEEVDGAAEGGYMEYDVSGINPSFQISLMHLNQTFFYSFALKYL
jgi:hypothetical protein